MCMILVTRMAVHVLKSLFVKYLRVLKDKNLNVHRHGQNLLEKIPYHKYFLFAQVVILTFYRKS